MEMVTGGWGCSSTMWTLLRMPKGEGRNGSINLGYPGEKEPHKDEGPQAGPSDPLGNWNS